MTYFLSCIDDYLFSCEWSPVTQRKIQTSLMYLPTSLGGFHTGMDSRRSDKD